MSATTALAVAAHPDDIEFMMAGTLLMLRRAGWEIHCLNVANGSCGSRRQGAAKVIVRRRAESREAARLLGAHCHSGWVNDLEVLYELKTLRRLAAAIREIAPRIILTHSPQDYMEDHVNVCRLTVTAAFSLGMRNFRTVPARPALEGETTLYHALPHGLRDGLRRRIRPGSYVNTTPVRETKLAALAAHRSQQDWLSASQGMNSYLQAMEDMLREVGRLSHRFTHAEGWRRHLHLGFASRDSDPLAEALGTDYWVDRRYEASLNVGS